MAACSGGGNSALPTASTNAPPTGNNGATIASVGSSILQPASTSHVQLVGNASAPATVDETDAATIAASLASVNQSQVAGMQEEAAHTRPTNSAAGPVTPSAHGRRAQDVAMNSPLDLLYIGGPVLGSAVSNNIYINCTASCRASSGLQPGQFLSDLGKDEYTELLYQYLASPGVAISTPLTGRYTKGPGVDIAWTPGPANAQPGYTNPLVRFGDIANWLVATIGAVNGLNDGQNHVYNIFLPPNTDRCLSASRCYSPDQPATNTFCAYHSYALLTTNTGVVPIYYTLIPDQGTPSCTPPGNLPLPNQVGSNQRTDATDSTLSHELFETITDPQLDAWYNLNLNSEIGDLCAYYDNFVTINHHKYMIQSEYSDIGHMCISANLTNENLVTIPGSSSGGH
ncbi:MAG: hypothetical protein JO036_00075 [Candidatus Eremiobacteraeota bacterium]|nr:hypothetical protein [Candidatus Eremiobacteraeota bacterium]